MTREMTKAGGRKGGRRKPLHCGIFQYLGQEYLTYTYRETLLLIILCYFKQISKP